MTAAGFLASPSFLFVIDIDMILCYTCINHQANYTEAIFMADMEEKIQYMLDLCEQGDPDACALMGKELFFGWNLEQDLDKAFRYLTVAAESGHDLSQFLLGSMYGSGKGTEKNPDLAYKWFLAAAEQGISEAMYNVACYLMGKGGEENRVLAREWLVKSANAGYDSAYDLLSDLED